MDVWGHYSGSYQGFVGGRYVVVRVDWWKALTIYSISPWLPTKYFKETILLYSPWRSQLTKVGRVASYMSGCLIGTGSQCVLSLVIRQERLYRAAGLRVYIEYLNTTEIPVYSLMLLELRPRVMCKGGSNLCTCEALHAISSTYLGISIECTCCSNCKPSTS